jgi:hypothetical protein
MLYYFNRVGIATRLCRYPLFYWNYEMDVLEAHAFFRELTLDEQRRLMPADTAITSTNNSGLDDRAMLPCFLASAAQLSGQLSDCRTLDDLLEALASFRILFDMENIDTERWSDDATEVFRDVEEQGMAFAMALGKHISRNAAFSQAELN